MTKKIKIKYRTLFLFMLVITIGCVPKDDNSKNKDEITGTEGLTIEFIKNFPQDNYVVSENEREPISVILNVRNKGAFPKQDNLKLLADGKIYLSGFDDEIIEIDRSSKSLSTYFLPGVSSINLVGGFDTVEFEDGRIIAKNILVDRYEPVILATICYPYQTIAGPSVCVDPFPFDENQDKVCRISSQTLTSQGAPVAVTRIDEEASSNKIRFKITIKNVGNGDVIKLGALGKCDPTVGQVLERGDFDRVELKKAMLGSVNLLHNCGPFAEGENNIIRLFEGEGYVICSLDKSEFGDAKSAYTTPLNIELSYGYRSTASKQIRILKVTELT